MRAIRRGDLCEGMENGPRAVTIDDVAWCDGRALSWVGGVRHPYSYRMLWQGRDAIRLSSPLSPTRFPNTPLVIQFREPDSPPTPPRPLKSNHPSLRGPPAPRPHRPPQDPPHTGPRSLTSFMTTISIPPVTPPPPRNSATPSDSLPSRPACSPLSPQPVTGHINPDPRH